MVFEKLYINEAGFSPVIMVDDLVKIHLAYRTKNGSTWNRSDVSYLGRRYNIVRGLASGQISSVKWL